MCRRKHNLWLLQMKLLFCLMQLEDLMAGMALLEQEKKQLENELALANAEKSNLVYKAETR